MLVITRREGERINVYVRDESGKFQKAVIEVIRCGSKTKLGFDAGEEFIIYREEVDRVAGAEGDRGAVN